MSLKRGSVFGVLMFCLILPATVSAQGSGVPGRIAALEAQLDGALATIARLQAALAAETTARQAADTTLQHNIDAMSGGGVSQAVLDAAIGAEASARAAADTLLQGNINAEATARAAFDATLAPVSALAPYVTVNGGTINDLAGPHVIFTGVNVHIRSGHSSGDSYTQNGRGNLVLGYNEPSDTTFPAERAGSHNLVVGPSHRYNFGVGLVVGGSSRLGSDGASVSGGFMNTASGWFASVGAGLRNAAVGDFALGQWRRRQHRQRKWSHCGCGPVESGDRRSVIGVGRVQQHGERSLFDGWRRVGLVNAVPFSFIP